MFLIETFTVLTIFLCTVLDFKSSSLHLLLLAWVKSNERWQRISSTFFFVIITAMKIYLFSPKKKSKLLSSFVRLKILIFFTFTKSLIYIKWNNKNILRLYKIVSWWRIFFLVYMMLRCLEENDAFYYFGIFFKRWIFHFSFLVYNLLSNFFSWFQL